MRKTGSDNKPTPQLGAIPVSIVIPVFNKLNYTRKCLDALRRNTPEGMYELVVVDNASTDQTREYLEQQAGAVRVVYNRKNQGFVEACNQGAARAKGRFLLFLNNDTEPQPGWLQAMLELVRTDEAIGAVGAKLVYPDGKLQEAGGIIFRDGSGWNYGRGDDPKRKIYNQVAEVDYCSGACLLVKKELFYALGGFDSRYAPAYCEDSDLCFGIRKIGYKVMYCPQAVIVHHEGATAGNDVSAGVKRYQVINGGKFVAKWRKILMTHPENPAVTNLPPVLDRRQRKPEKGNAAWAAGEKNADGSMIRAAQPAMQNTAAGLATTALLLEYEKQIAELQTMLVRKDEESQLQKAIVHALEKSNAFKFLLKYYRFRDRYFPVNTRRRFIFEAIIKVIINPRLLTLEKFRRFSSRGFKLGEKSNNQEPSRRTDGIGEDALKAGLMAAARRPALRFHMSAQPELTVLYCLNSQWQYAYASLKALQSNLAGKKYEIIAWISSAERDNIKALNQVKGLRVFGNTRKPNDIKQWTSVFKGAKGKYCLVIDSRSILGEKWLEPLLQAMKKDKMVGIASGKLLGHMDRIQEAGSIVWKDGKVEAYGTLEAARNYPFNYAREVDCFSGAPILIRLSALADHKTDQTWKTFYYSKLDLQFTVRKAGHKILYHPEVVAAQQGLKLLAAENAPKETAADQRKFSGKWRGLLANRVKNTKTHFLARESGPARKCILFIDDKVPEYDKHAGGLTTYQYVMLFNELGFKVVYFPHELAPLEPYTAELQRQGVEVIHGAFDFNGWLQLNGRYLQYIWLARPEIASQYLETIRRFSRAKLLYYTHDLHYLRLERQYAVEKKRHIWDDAVRYKKMEHGIFRQVDVTMTPSDYEQSVVKKDFPQKRVETIPAYFYHFSGGGKAKRNGAQQREGLLFLGGYQHTPNVDAAKWLAREIFPKIKKKLPECTLYLAGSHPTAEVMALEKPGVKVLGFIEDLAPLFGKIKVFVSPLRFGAGVKGKIVTSLYYGVPVVTTTVGNEGINLTPDQEALIADTADEFVQKVIELYTDDRKWRRLSEQGQAALQNKFSKDKALEIIKSIL